MEPRRKYKIQPASVWEQVRKDYLAGEGARVVAERYGVGEEALRARATRQGWSRYLQKPTPPAEGADAPVSALFEALADDGTDDPADLAQAATRASALAMRAGELARAHALAGLAERYRKLAGSDDARHKALTPDTAPLQLVADILMDEGLANRRLALNNPKDPPCPTKIAYQDWDSRRSRVSRNFHFTLVHRRAACERYIDLLERALTAAGLPLPDEPDQNRRVRLGLDVRVGDTVMSHEAYRERLGEE